MLLFSQMLMFISYLCHIHVVFVRLEAYRQINVVVVVVVVVVVYTIQCISRSLLTVFVII